MRERKEIMDGAKNLAQTDAAWLQIRILEVLLDIRDLLRRERKWASR